MAEFTRSITCLQQKLHAFTGHAVSAAAAAKKEKWLKDNPGQMVITAGQIVWTAQCEKALSDADSAKKALKALKKKWVSYLNKLTAVTRSKLSAIERNKVWS
jgi:dynein heavy chain